jgi:hypothetical protein
MFNLADASKELQAIAASYGLTKGKWKPVNSGSPVSQMSPDTVVAIIVEDNQSVEVIAGEIFGVPPLVGLKEAAEISGIPKATLAQYRMRGFPKHYPPFPDPVEELASGPVWRKNDIEKFKGRKEKK